MPLEVIMPALGMAQDTGLLVSWQKRPGDKVAEGDVLFEVETDKSTMEVEAQGDGYLTNVTASAGDHVPVGQVIAHISDSLEASTRASAPQPDSGSGDDRAGSLPEGYQVIMPTLGMAQDSGRLVSWLAEPGAEIEADDVLFEMETDKSTVEVPAGASGYLAALLAEPGEDVSTGQVIAVISVQKPGTVVQRSAASNKPSTQQQDVGAKAGRNVSSEGPGALAAKEGVLTASAVVIADPVGRVLASPKARRLAMAEGLDLQQLVRAGYPQPFHVSDLGTLRAMAVDEVGTGNVATHAGHRLEAELSSESFTAFAEWAASETGRNDATGLLAALAAASLRRASGAGGEVAVAVERFGKETLYKNSAGLVLGIEQAGHDAKTGLRVRDMRGSRITTLALGPEDVPVLTMMTVGKGLRIVLECGTGQISLSHAIILLSEFAGRIEDPLRHLL